MGIWDFTDYGKLLSNDTIGLDTKEIFQKWIAECASCQQQNAPQPAAQVSLVIIIACHPFEIISWDIMGPLLLTTQGNRYVLFVTDLFSKWTEAFPLKTIDSETLAKVLIDEVIFRYGIQSRSQLTCSGQAKYLNWITTYTDVPWYNILANSMEFGDT